MDPEGIQEFGGHWEWLTLPRGAALPSQPAHNALDKAVTGLGARADWEGHRGPVALCFCTPSTAWGLGLGMGRGDSVLERGQRSGEVTVSWRGDSAISLLAKETGHGAGTDLIPPRGHLRSFGTQFNHGPVSGPAGSVLGARAVPSLLPLGCPTSSARAISSELRPQGIPEPPNELPAPPRAGSRAPT